MVFTRVAGTLKWTLCLLAGILTLSFQTITMVSWEPLTSSVPPLESVCISCISLGCLASSHSVSSVPGETDCCQGWGAQCCSGKPGWGERRTWEMRRRRGRRTYPGLELQTPDYCITGLTLPWRRRNLKLRKRRLSKCEMKTFATKIILWSQNITSNKVFSCPYK